MAFETMKWIITDLGPLNKTQRLKEGTESDQKDETEEAERLEMRQLIQEVCRQPKKKLFNLVRGIGGLAFALCFALFN